MTSFATDVDRVGRAAPDRVLALVVVALAAVAWVAVALTHGTALDHHALGGLLASPDASADHHSHGADHAEHGGGAASAGPGAATVALLILGGWSVMVVAMMLPPALPLLRTLRGLTARQRHSHTLVLLGAAAFVGIWTWVGAVLVGGDAVLHAVVERQPWADRAPQFVTGAVLAGAGLYQFTPLKRACLRACRSPRSFALAHWSGRRSAAAELVAVSSSYAVSCVGCCWALMAVSLAVGAAALPVMVVLAGVMAAERLVSWGRRLVTPIGLALIALGALTAFGLSPITSS